MAAVPAPLACDGETAHDPVSRSVLVKVSGFGGRYWRRGHAAMVEAEEAGRYWGAPSVYAHAPGRRQLARGVPVRDGWLRFQLSDADYRKLVNTPDLAAIVTVDKEAGRIWVSGSHTAADHDQFPPGGRVWECLRFVAGRVRIDRRPDGSLP